jgi:lysophospholipase L1-like esterase
MKFRSLIFTGATLLLAIFTGAPAVATPGPFRIMPLGDSTTAGSYGAGQDGMGGCRVELARLCREANLPVDFVGSLKDPAGATFDAGREGHRAWRIDHVADNVAGWLRVARPDVVLVQRGSNDLIQGATLAEGVARFSRLLDQCQGARPSAKFHIAGILSVREPDDYRVAPRALEEFNARLPALAAVHAQRGLHAGYVDLAAQCAFPAADFSADGLHPSDQGYSKIGAVWFHLLTAGPTGHHP